MKNTIEEIENDFWGDPEYHSHLVVTCHNLRKKNLDEFEIEDLRIMISQNIALPVLIPLAVKELKENIFAEGPYYEGDLLKAVLTSEKEYWDKNETAKEDLISMVASHFGKIQEMDTSAEIKTSILDAWENFKR